MSSYPVASTSKLPPAAVPSAVDDEEGEDEERLDLAALQGFADKIQRRPLEDDVDGEDSRIKIVIPKRGEKDFEPLAETVNLQEMMLQRSREALFGALAGVRGGNSKAVSHAILTPDSIYPKMLITRGRLLDSMGISVRYKDTAAGRSRTYIELLPEEALYLLERGTLQIWLGRLAGSPAELESGVGEYCEEEYGVKGAVEMSVMEGFAAFIGAEGLTWERYQAFSYLKRLGYTVQRSRRFIPTHFTSQESTGKLPTKQHSSMTPFRSWWLSLPSWLARLSRALFGRIAHMTSAIAGVGLRVFPTGRISLSTTLAGSPRRWSSYGHIMANLRLTPTSHAQSVPQLPRVSSEASIYSPLDLNPYIPFWHVWKPATHWSKVNWDRGSASGFVNQKPEYIVAVINARDTPMPSLAQLSQVFDSLPDEPKGPVKKLGPQYEKPVRPGPNRAVSVARTRSIWNPANWLSRARSSDQPQGNGNPMAALRNGDRGLVVAVNDSGNTGWVRFGRTGFADHVVI